MESRVPPAPSWGTQPQITAEELVNCELVVRSGPRVQALAKEFGEPVVRCMHLTGFDVLT